MRRCQRGKSKTSTVPACAGCGLKTATRLLSEFNLSSHFSTADLGQPAAFPPSWRSSEPNGVCGETIEARRARKQLDAEPSSLTQEKQLCCRNKRSWPLVRRDWLPWLATRRPTSFIARDPERADNFPYPCPSPLTRSSSCKREIGRSTPPSFRPDRTREKSTDTLHSSW